MINRFSKEQRMVGHDPREFKFGYLHRKPHVFPGTDNVDNITVDGYSTVTVTPTGGSPASVGYVGKIECYANGIIRETTKGPRTVGFDLGIKWEMAETRLLMFTSIIDARLCDSVTAAGQMTSVSLSGGVGMKITAKFNLSNKADSMIECEAIKPGIRPSNAKSFITDVAS